MAEPRRREGLLRGLIDTPFPLCSDPRVKFAAPLLALAVFSLVACNTLVTRRDVYSPQKGHGPYSQALKEGTWKDGVKVKATPAPKPAVADEPKP